MSIQRRHFLQAAALAAPALHFSSAMAQGLPPGALRIISPYAAGDGTDTVCRLLGESMRQDLKRDVIVENRAGGAGLIGVTAMVNSAPDGLTFGLIGSQHVTLQTLYKRFEPLRQTEPITRLTVGAFSIVVASDSKYKSIQELFKAMVDEPGKISYGSGGIGTPAHFCMELLRGRIKGFEPLHVPFKAAIESVAAAAGGQIDCAVGISSTAFPIVLGGKARCLAVTSAERATALPNVPTLTESVAPGFVHTAWSGFATPKGTPPAAVKALYDAIKSASMKPELAKFMAASSGTVQISASPAAFAAELLAEIDDQSRVIRERDIKPNT